MFIYAVTPVAVPVYLKQHTPSPLVFRPDDTAGCDKMAQRTAVKCEFRHSISIASFTADGWLSQSILALPTPTAAQWASESP